MHRDRGDEIRAMDGVGALYVKFFAYNAKLSFTIAKQQFRIEVSNNTQLEIGGLKNVQEIHSENHRSGR